ncbi:MAG: hypothetical protein Q9160_001329 [Pyrenula sp. 1 TL-2023]
MNEPRALAKNTRLHPSSQQDHLNLLPLPRRGRISGDLESAKAVQWASEKLRECNEMHSRCLYKEDNIWRPPARVLDLGWEEDRVRIIDFGSRNDRYACLSHCWGGLQQCETKHTNLELHKTEGISMTSLSKTFRDTIEFVRRLGGIQFLWIDSLCVIQDDVNDRNREIAAMCDIYRGCWICIAATAARDGSAGLFTQVPSEYVGYTLQNDFAGENAFFYKPISHHSFALTNGMQGEPFPLFTRAWVYQERRLAPRIFHFTSYELVWECSTATKCECGKAENRDLLWKKTLALRKDMDGMVDFWHDQVREYTKLDLSRPSDKLPAIGGLAQEESLFRNGRYLAGLWEDSLVPDLAWYADSYEIKNAKPTTWRAPSWSWASISNSVHYIKSLRPACKVVSAVCKSADGTNIFGEVVSGALTLSGHTVEAHIDINAWGSMKIRTEEGVFSAIDLDYKPDEVFQHLAQNRGEVLCLLLGHTRYDPVSIILKPVSGKPNTYERFASYMEEPWDRISYEAAEIRTITII